MAETIPSSLHVRATAALLLLPIALAAQDDAAAKQRVPFLRPQGGYADLAEMGFSPLDLLGGGGGPPKPFYGFVEAVDGLAKVPESEVVLDLSGSASFNLPQLRELQRAIERVRSAGKQVICYLENAGAGAYQLAASCDRILMADMGTLDLVSPSMSVMHFKDALDLLGIQVEVTRVGDFKGAVEPFLLPTISEHLRQHYAAMLETMNADIVKRIAAGRRLPEERVRALQAQRLISADDALRNGLVDHVVPWSGAARALAASRGSDRFELVDAGPKKKKQSRDLMALISGLLRQSKEEDVDAPQVVVLHLSGQIVDGDKPSPGSMVSGPAVAAIDKLAATDLVKGVVVRINSPGGSATASEAIRLALQRLAARKPVVFSMGELAASGGYWITAIGEPVLAEVTTITGSIGVFGMRFQAGALMRRLGVHAEIVRLDDGPLLQAIDRPWSEAHRQRMQSFVDGIYQGFLARVAAARRQPVEYIDAVAGGRVWSGSQAVELGLVDAIGGLDDALALVRQRTGLGDEVEIRHAPEPKNFADALFSSLFESAIAAGHNRAELAPLLAQCARFVEVAALLREALAGDGANRVYALMPPGLRVQ